MELSTSKKELVDQVAELLAEGLKQKDIADTLGISESYVSRVKKELQIMKSLDEDVDDYIVVPVLMTRRLYDEIKAERKHVANFLLTAGMNSHYEWNLGASATPQPPQANTPAPSFETDPDFFEEFVDEDLLTEPKEEVKDQDEVLYGPPQECPNEVCDGIGDILVTDTKWKCSDCGIGGYHYPDRPYTIED